MDLDSVDKYPNLTRKLLEAGFTAVEIHKIYGGNFLRFMRAVESAAHPNSRAAAAGLAR